MLSAEQGDDPYRVQADRRALTRWAARPDWNDVLSNFARCVRITREFTEPFPLDITRDPEPMHARAVRCLSAVCGAASRCTAAWTSSLTAFAPLVPDISKFFVDVLVMAQDQAVRETRLALLAAHRRAAARALWT